MRHVDWFWNPNEDHHVNPLDKMMKMYYQSVGHNSTLILGITPDNRGLIPNADVSRLKEWGDSIKKVFKTPVASLKPQQKDYTINIPVQKYFLSKGLDCWLSQFGLMPHCE